jgi:hypothetical protein
LAVSPCAVEKRSSLEETLAGLLLLVVPDGAAVGAEVSCGTGCGLGAIFWVLHPASKIVNSKSKRVRFFMLQILKLNRK